MFSGCTHSSVSATVGERFPCLSSHMSKPSPRLEFSWYRPTQTNQYALPSCEDTRMLVCKEGAWTTMVVCLNLIGRGVHMGC